jgi:putative membrane protein
MNPAMITAWIFGLILFFGNLEYLKTAGWMHAKLLFVVFLTALHMVFARYRKNFERDANTRPAKFYRIINEAPTVLMIFIIIMAVAEPF